MKKIMIIGNGDIGSTMMVHAMAGLANAQGIEIIAQTENPFDKEPLKFIPVPKCPELKQLYDKKGKLLPLPKFHR